MSSAVPTTDSAVRYFAEFQHGVQVTSRAEGAHRENWVNITAPRRSPDPVARFAAPYIPDSRRIGHDVLLHANGWRALGPWEYIAGLNAYRAPVEPLRPLITAGQSAVRAAEEHGSPETVRGLDAVLCALPLVDGRADLIVHEALRAVARAEDAEEWELLADAERAVSRLIQEPDGATMKHPAVLAVAMLATRCAVNDKEAGAGVGATWNRGHMLGLEALAAVTGVACGYATGQALDNAMVAFSTAVRRAIPYAALYATRNALVGAAGSYGLFVVGMRQPPSIGGRWEWERVIGGAVFQFEVTSLGQPHPYGSLAVRRVGADGTPGPVRYFPLGPDEDNERAAVRYRI
ncbi:hypothetical protein ACIQCG_00920 [Streptomyces noursei]|uniref:hypothetical protein n=1 Tax=Streptomyces noursei TaxID=1971 RepID=UPI0038038028